jgi:predicted O-methyltransferase YrrM
MRLERRAILEKNRRVDTTPERRMLAITPDTARFYHKLLRGINAKNVLELGTSSGYSTLWFVDAMLQNTKTPKIITIEGSPVKVQMAQGNFEAAGVSEFIKIRHGQILDVLYELPKRTVFDFVLIDADKENATKYFDLVLPRLKIGGIIATDNVLLPKRYRKFMRKYITHIRKNRNVVTGTIPLGYGQEITVRLS